MRYLLMASVIWAFSYSLIKTYLVTLDPNLVSFCRLAFAFSLFLPFLKWSHLRLNSILRLFFIGGIQYGLMYLFFLQAFRYLPAHQIVLFTVVTPFYVVLIHDLWEKKLNIQNLLFAILAVGGGLIIYYQPHHSQQLLIGFLFVQLSDLCFAFGQVAYKKFRTQCPQLADKEIYALPFAGALLVAACATSYSQQWSQLTQISGQQWLLLAYLGILASGICFFWWNKGAVRVNTGILAVFNNLKAPLGFVVALLFFHETTNLPRLCAGLCLLLVALFLAQRQSRPKEAAYG